MLAPLPRPKVESILSKVVDAETQKFSGGHHLNRLEPVAKPARKLPKPETKKS